MVIYGWGYQRRTLDELREHQRKLNALIVDVRLVPQGRTPPFRRAALMREFPNDYLWVRAFGNINYKARAGGVHLVDPGAGLSLLESAGVSEVRPPLLLCVCGTAACHRLAVAGILVERFGGKFVDLARMQQHAEEKENGPSSR